MAKRGALAVAAAACGLPLALTWSGSLHDVLLYCAWARELAAGAVPYRDFAVEYPPLALLAVTLPGLVTRSVGGFAATFMVAVAAVAAAQKLLLARVAARPLWLLAAVGLAEAPLHTTYLKRYDVLAAAVTSAALVAVARNPRQLRGFVWLGVGTALKLYPLLLLPCCLGYAWRRRTPWRRLAAQVGCAVGGLPLTAALAWLACGPASAGWLHYHHARGLHLASSATAAWLLAGHWDQPVGLTVAYGTLQVVAPWADAWAHLAGGALALGLAATYAVTWRQLTTPRGLWRSAAAVCCATLSCSKVFSPQFVAWLVPLVALSAVGWRPPTAPPTGPPASRPRRPRLDVGQWLLLLGVAVCTAQLFPGEVMLAQPHHHKRPWLVARTGLLLASWAWAAFDLAGLDRAGGAGDGKRPAKRTFLRRFARGA